MEDGGFGFVGCFVLGSVGGLGFVLCWLAKKKVGWLGVASPVSPTRKTRIVTFTLTVQNVGRGIFFSECSFQRGPTSVLITQPRPGTSDDPRLLRKSLKLTVSL